MFTGEGTVEAVLAGEARWALTISDCRAWLASLPSDSVDSCVCDPPYELGFMGRKWDASGIAYDVPMWREVLRVLKPGSHLLAFGGTRTYHRMACAIEDAGFDIRDCIGWVFGQGFPKSLNVSAGLDVKRCRCDASERDLRDMQGGVCDAENTKQNTALLLSEMLGQDAGGAPDADRRLGSLRLDTRDAGARQREDDRGAQPGMEGRGDLLSQTRELRAGEVRSLPAGVHRDGATGWVRDGAPAADGAKDRARPVENGGRSPRGSQPAEQRDFESGAVAEQREPQIGGTWATCGRCGKPVVPDGIGTALKPAWESVVVARKPLIGTVAENVLAHGTGGMNIDACRVGWASEDDKAAAAAAAQRACQDQNAGRTVLSRLENGSASLAPYLDNMTAGRWPANVIHDGSPEVLEAFARYGERDSGASVGDGGRIFGRGGGPTHDGYAGDSGTAARFFFCAKASRAERELGCDGVAFAKREDMTGRTEGSAGQKHARSGVTRTGAFRNVHPTVKPLALMRYLCRLVTPPGGVVLDPFTGSGTCGMAALLESFRYLGCELEEAHGAIARARIGHPLRIELEERATPSGAAQMALFGKVGT